MTGADVVNGNGAPQDKPVFFDPTRRRWTSFLTLSAASAAAVAAILASLSLSIYEGAAPVQVALEERPQDPVTIASTAPADPETEPLLTVASVPSSPRIEPIALPQPAPQVEAEAPREAAEIVMAAAPVAPVAPIPPARPEKFSQSQPAVTAETVIAPSIQLLPRAASSIDILAPDDAVYPVAAPNPGPLEIDAPSFVEMVLGAVGSVLISEANATEFTSALEPQTYAFHVNWSHEAIASFKENILKIDTLLPEWVYLADDRGGIGFDLPDVTAEILAEIRTEQPQMRVVPVLTDQHGGAFHPERVDAILANSEARRALVGNLQTYLAEHALHGVALRFSRMDAIETSQLSLLVDELRAALAADQRQVYVVLPGEAGLSHADAISRVADAVIVEGWGQTYSGEAPGPLASQNWFDHIAAQWQAAVRADRLVFAIRNIAYDWGTDPVAQQISTLEAMNRARIAGEAIELDPATLNTSFSYDDTEGQQHTVWMLDGVSAYNQVRSLMRMPPRGIALARLGNEDSAVWDLLAAPSAMNPAMLERLDYSTQISRHGVGEIIKVTQLPERGDRDVTVSGDGVVTAASITTFPRSYEIAHWGGGDRDVIALTFDDGPDPLYTGQILDILAEHEVPASFFATGAQMMRHPEMVKRILAEGHEVGSHTYSHTNISRMTPEMLRFDLNATQRVFESITGRNLLLFRAPYAVDANPQIAAEIAPISTVGQLGYLTVNMNIDPKDWWAPDADRIVSATVRQVEAGLRNIVLLHDAGGDRSQTVAALPRIIEELRARGYRFATASQLIGLAPDDVMPQSERAATLGVALDGLGFSLLRIGEIALSVAFVLAIGLGITRAVILIVLSALRRRPSTRLRPVMNGPKVGIIVPAYNEEKVIAKTVRSLLASQYWNFEILIVDDGSRDGTVALCEREFGNDPRVRIFTKPNGGKSSALNFGFTRTDAEIIVALDADTIFTPHTIGWLAGRFSDPRIGAVAGNAKVGNRVNILTRWQATEYITSQNLDRRAFELLNCVTVVPGAVGAWRREAVIALGGYTSDTLAEDADLTIRLLRAGYRVVYEERAVAYTEAPETTRQLFKQRFRWMFGMLQTTVKHRDALLLKDSKSVAFIALPHILVFQILFTLVAPIADIVALVALGDLAVKVVTESSMMNTGQIIMFLALFFSFIVLDFMTGVMAFRLEKEEDWRLLFWVPLQRFYYRQLLYIVALKAMLTAVRGSLVGWGNLARTASVSPDAAKSAR